MTFDPMFERRRNALLLGDNRTWDPQIPRDLGAPPPPIAADGTAACSSCQQRRPLAQLEITAHGYQCAACAAHLPLAAGAAIDPDQKIGRGRWWLLPLLIAVGAVLTILYPGAILIGSFVVAAIVLRVLMWRGRI